MKSELIETKVVNVVLTLSLEEAQLLYSQAGSMVCSAHSPIDNLYTALYDALHNV